MSKPYRFHEGHYKGFKILLQWCVEKYKKLNSPIAKQMWNNNIRFLARMQKEQFYTEEQRQELNKIRRSYINEKNLDKKWKTELGNSNNTI